MDVSIIIVSYNTKQLIKNCIQSIFEKSKNIEFEVIVSDNGSKDGSIEMISSEFPQVILIENNENLGFGTANNRGLKRAKGKYVFYLNSDTVLLNNAVKIFFDYWELHQKENIGALGCNLLDMRKNIIHSYGYFPTIESTLKKYKISLFKLRILFFFPFLTFIKSLMIKSKSMSKKLGCVEYITGAALFVTNNSFAFFDENFFLYFEETDLQKKLSTNGFSRILIEGPEIVHLEGGSNDIDKKYVTSFSYHESNKSNIKYLEKYFNTKDDEILKIRKLIAKNYSSHLIKKYMKEKVQEIMNTKYFEKDHV